MTIPLILALFALLLGPTDQETVSRVLDGDTVEFADGNKARIRGIDTPEVFGGRECGGPEASQFAKTTLTGQRVTVLTNPGDLRDRYGRLVAELRLPDGRSYAVEVTRAGWAEAYTFNRKYPATDRAAIEAAEQDARAANRGMWGLCPR